MIFKESGAPSPEEEIKFKIITEPFEENGFRGTIEKRFDPRDNSLQEIVIKDSKGEIIIYKNVPACKKFNLEQKFLKYKKGTEQ